tara:strand:+ start:324 stop:488 length:165 start_codon:yes stop_codon:yes gene_type:complete
MEISIVLDGLAMLLKHAADDGGTSKFVQKRLHQIARKAEGSEGRYEYESEAGQE